MNNDEAVAIVAEALEMGLTFTAKATDGDYVSVGLAGINRKKTFEFAIAQTLSQFISRDSKEIAKLAVEQAGKRIGNEAEKVISIFVRQAKKTNN